MITGSIGWFIGYYVLSRIEILTQPLINVSEESKVIIRVLNVFIFVMDITIRLTPAIVLYAGFPTTALVLFGLLGIITSVDASKGLYEAGMEDSLLNRILVVIHYLLTQVPYITFLVVR